MKNVEDVYPLSPMQEGMLFDALYEPGSGAYVIQVNSKIQGDCNIPVFQRAWQKILERYPSLRSAFVWDRVDRPLQVVRKQVGLTWDQPDWRGLPEEDQESKIKEYLYKERRRGFNFFHAPLNENGPHPVERKSISGFYGAVPIWSWMVGLQISFSTICLYTIVLTWKIAK